MIELLLPILGIAVVDSLNPSALLVTVFLLSHPNPAPRVMVYLGGVFSAYLGIGVALVLGVDALSGSIAVVLESPAAYGAQLVIGAALLGYAVFAPDPPARDGDDGLRARTGGGLGALWLLGAVVTVVELGTALPYFGAIAVLGAGELPPAEWLPLLVAYNVVFVLPPLAILTAHRLARARIRERLERSGDRIRRNARQTFLWIAGIVGFLLVADAAVFFLGLR